MKELVSNLIKRYATGIEVDDTPTTEDINNQRSSIMSKPDIIPVDADRKNIDKSNAFKEREFRAKPKVKPPRREHKPAKFDSKETRNDYMEDYRAQGKDLEKGNKYVKKFKGD